MEPRRQLHFGPFRFDPERAQLWREDRAVELRPKTLAVLRCLVDRPGRPASSEELLDEVWAGTRVTRTVW